MKRTGEIVLGIIGMILSLFLVIGGIFFVSAQNSEEVRSAVEGEIIADPAMEISQQDMNMVFQVFASFGWALVIAALIGVIFGLVAILNIKGNKRPKLAGWMFIVGAVLTGLISVGLGFIPALLYLIAGIMCFVRKPPVMQEDPTVF